MDKHIIPARQGAAFRVAEGQRIRIETPKGAQTADFFAFNAQNIGEWLSPNHTWAAHFRARPRQGDAFLSRFRRPMLDFTEDGADGVHDMMIPACDHVRYEFFGHEGHHPNCAENLHIAMRRLGYQIDVVPQPVNFFMDVSAQPDGSLVSPPNSVKPGGYVLLTARMDLICAVSSCPFDLPTDSWAINASGGPTELAVSVS
ncbi:DUF1989 domain-containing protein [Roseovarius spongiae]|nr:urea carboxylase-associated family protein [Roseovarius spongiae]